MKILAIETSCDETAVSLLEITGPQSKPEIKVLGNTLMSQAQMHKEYGGVYPNLAKREHEKNLPKLLEMTLREAKEDLNKPNIDCIAVTSGPGLEPALWVGISFAEKLGKEWQKPVIPTNHMAGHIYSVLFDDKISELRLPAIALLVSGGHTELVLIKDFGHYEILGRTRDDAVGEAFDKVARMLGLPYPGGPEISHLAKKSRERSPIDTIKLPRPMINSKDLDFSFSGLKTAVLYRIKSENELSEKFKEDMARAFEEAAVETLVAKTRRAIKENEGTIKTLIIGGGVAANIYLLEKAREMKGEFPTVELRIPTRSLATDNAMMIGAAAYINIISNPKILEEMNPIRASGNLLLSS